MTVQQPDIQWYIARDGKQHGPLSDVEMRTFVGQGHLRPTDLIWRAGFADWRPAPAVFPFQAPEPQRAPVHVPATRPTGQVRTSGFPEHSFEPERIRVSRGMRDRTPLRMGLIVAASVLLALMAGAGGWYLWQKAASLKSEYAQSSGTDTSKQAANKQTARETAASILTTPPPTAPAVVTAMQTPPPAASAAPAVAQPSAEAVAKSEQDLDAKFQQMRMWGIIKHEFPDWYNEQLREAATLAAQNRPQVEIAKHLAQALVELRRKHADQALAASTEKLKVIASAFLENLKSLSERGIGACYGFISQGETSPAVTELLLSPQDGTAIQAQLAAIFEAIADGRNSPKTHARALKGDYEILVQQLTKLGWKENDLKTFSNPTALSHEPPGHVCQMVQDWFLAHLSVQDKGAQERLLVETLKPVVSG